MKDIKLSVLIILARIFCSVNFGLDGEGVGGGVGAHIAAHIGLDREVSGHYCSVDRCPCAHTHTHILLFFFLKARRAVMGPAKRGPIWAG